MKISKISKENKILIVSAVILTGLAIFLTIYTKKRMLKETFEYYDEQPKEVKVL